jgi:uncharacterized protein YidB (DUF937 family)
MGLLDSMLGSVLNSQQGAGQVGGQQSGAGGLDALLPAVIGMLANNGQGGGLGGLMEKFNQAGMGEVLGSWIGSGQNAPISGADLGAVLGGDTMGDLAAQLGMSQNDAAGQLAQVLPGLIDKLTPRGNAPEGGFGNAGDLFGMLGGLLQQK